jgi:hypothetical protein
MADMVLKRKIRRIRQRLNHHLVDLTSKIDFRRVPNHEYEVYGMHLNCGTEIDLDITLTSAMMAVRRLLTELEAIRLEHEFPQFFKETEESDDNKST